MTRGVDLSTDSRPGLACLKASSFGFIARYYCRTGSKLLSVAEARAIVAAGMRVVAVWESGRPTSVDYFSKAKGMSDGSAAYRYARDTIRQPAGSAIYFAVDYDAAAAHVTGPIKEYFQGIVEAFQSEAQGSPAYRIGVYGSGAVCKAFLGSGAAQCAWLSQSTGWRGTKTFTAWNIKQGRETTLCGLRVDTNEGAADEGGFVVPVEAPAPPVAVPVTVTAASGTRRVVTLANPPSVARCPNCGLPGLKDVQRWRGTPSKAIQKWATAVLREKHPLGTVVYDTVDGTPVVARVECHDGFGADPSKPKRWHKGVTVYRPKAAPDVTTPSFAVAGRAVASASRAKSKSGTGSRTAARIGGRGRATARG